MTVGRDAHPGCDVRELAAIIAKQPARSVVRHIHVELAVIVVIADCDADTAKHQGPACAIDSQLVCDVDEVAAVIAIKPIEVAVLIRNEQVQVAVLVIIEPGCAGGKTVHAKACPIRYVLERTVPAVMEQPAFAMACHKQVRVAVIVIIADGDTVAVIEMFAGDTRLSRHVFKRPIALVAQQAVVE